ncbi:hypothetical protein O3G_MSEX000776 [Manduca sexta]|nr:hypothetical protein O3G_MSEX000776 [Manduca sexta]
MSLTINSVFQTNDIGSYAPHRRSDPPSDLAPQATRSRSASLFIHIDIREVRLLYFKPRANSDVKCGVVSVSVVCARNGRRRRR